MTAARSIRFSLAFGLALAAVPANAQLAPSGRYGFTKTEAILGGAPSRLAAIMAAQSNGRPVGITIASLAAPSAAPSLYRPAPFVLHAVQPLAIAPISSDRPDVFNSVALPVSHTPLDARWGGVVRRGVTGSSAAFADSLAGRDQMSRIEAVNAYVNHKVRFVDDRPRFGVADRWSAASETLGSGRGDCEDYAIAKMALLRRAGFAERDLYLVVLKDLVRRADHAVLVVRSAGRFLVLDNGTDRVIDSSEIRDYRPILTFTAGRAFTHGYRRDPVQPPVTYAMAEQPVAPAFGLTLAAATLPASLSTAIAAR